MIDPLLSFLFPLSHFDLVCRVCFCFCFFGFVFWIERLIQGMCGTLNRTKLSISINSIMTLSLIGLFEISDRSFKRDRATACIYALYQYCNTNEQDRVPSTLSVVGDVDQCKTFSKDSKLAFSRQFGPRQTRQSYATIEIKRRLKDDSVHGPAAIDQSCFMLRECIIIRSHFLLCARRRVQ